MSFHGLQPTLPKTWNDLETLLDKQLIMESHSLPTKNHASTNVFTITGMFCVFLPHFFF